MGPTGKMNFRMMSFIHETLYGLFRDALKALNAAGLEAGQQVLEVGCGPGFFTIPAAEIVGEGGSVLALDVNPLAVEHVQHKIETEGVTNAKTLLADAARTNLADQSFDLVFVFGLAHARGGVDKIWPELHRVLKSQGILAVEGRQGPPESLFEAVRRDGRISRFRRMNR
jgi:ubiquinone/menaquinone biosynthesis C-methylase UbiE